MILDFRGKEYKCHYYDGQFKQEHICFSRGADKGVLNNEHHVTYFLDKTPNEINYVFLSKFDLISYLQEISKLLGFKLISLKENVLDYRLQVTIPNDKRFFLYVSTLIRYTYEFPFNLALYCACNNRDSFPELNIIQIMQLYRALFITDRDVHNLGTNQQCFSNLNSKCYFNTLRHDFCASVDFIYVVSSHTKLINKCSYLNTKQLSQVVEGINIIVNNYYEKYKKDICRW